MTPELESELRTTVASLRVRTACQELLILALPPPRLMTVARVAAEEDIPLPLRAR